MEHLIRRINTLSVLRSRMEKPSPEFDAVTSVLEACNAIRWSLDSPPSVIPLRMLKLMGKPTPQESYHQVMKVLDHLNGALAIFNKQQQHDKNPKDIVTYDEHIRGIGDISQTLLGHPNPKFQKLGGAMAFMGVVLIVASLLAAPATFGLSLALPAAVVLMASWIAMVPPMTLVMGSVTAAGGVYTGVSNLRETGLAKAVSDLTALDSMKPKH